MTRDDGSDMRPEGLNLANEGGRTRAPGHPTTPEVDGTVDGSERVKLSRESKKQQQQQQRKAAFCENPLAAAKRDLFTLRSEGDGRSISLINGQRNGNTLGFEFVQQRPPPPPLYHLKR
jgi:hypothetical protein